MGEISLKWLSRGELFGGGEQKKTEKNEKRLFFFENVCYNTEKKAGYTFGSLNGGSMSLFKKIFKNKDPNSPSARADRAKELHGQAIRYVTERRDNVDEIVGRGGCLSARNGEFLLLTSGEILFRTDVEDLQASYLLSGDGVVIKGPNKEEGGRERSLIAYFVYYRK